MINLVSIPGYNFSSSNILTNQDDLPLVSIGLPVYNEAGFIEHSLLALLDQDYPNLEIIISDNGSSDETNEIVEKLCSTDKRAQLHHFDENQGANANFRFVLKRATGKYFMWASGHDLWSSNLVSECVNLLEAHPDATIAFGTPEWVDIQGSRLEQQTGWADTRGLDPVGKFMSVLWGSMNPILGVIRKDALPDMGTFYGGVGADLSLLLTLILKGDFIHAQTAKFIRRQPRAKESYSQKLSRYKSNDVRITDTFFSKMFPLLRLPYEIFRTVFKSRLNPGIKLAIIILLIPALPIRYIMGRKS